jgi:hypothetical protein
MSSPRLERLALFLVAAVSIAAFALIATDARPAGATGAIDTVGHYAMSDSSDPGGPRYHDVHGGVAWHDLHQSDDSEASYALPFPFTFYGTTYTSATIGANGAIAFPSGQQVGDVPQNLVAADTHQIAAWWSDWVVVEDSPVLVTTVGTAPHRTFVVWWDNVYHHTGGYADFQAFLSEGSNRIEVTYRFNEVEWPPAGPDAVIGVDNGTTSYLQHNLKSPPPEFAIRFEPQSCLGKAATVVGTHESEHLVGTPGDDVIAAYDGNDVVDGRGGNDLICAGRGDDRVNAGGGRDRIIAGRGTDDLRGNAGADRLEGSLGRDTCRGGPGQDVALGCEVRVS